MDYCRDHNHNPYVTSVNAILKFLHTVYTKGLSYSTLNGVRSALSAFVSIENSSCSIGNHPLISRYLKGVFNIKPPLPRYRQIWDSRVVLNRLRSWGPVLNLTLKQLTLKLCMMLALLGAARTQLLQAFRTDKIEISDSRIILRVDKLMKTDRPGKIGHELILKAYPVDRRLCVVRTMRRYLEITKTFREAGDKNQLFLSLNEPHNPVSKDTIAKWIRQMLSLSGIDITVFKAHSVRAASVSTAKVNFVSTQDIMKRADWTQEKTFQEYYNKTVDNVTSYDDAILNV